jgi:hypothetical protein
VLGGVKVIKKPLSILTGKTAKIHFCRQKFLNFSINQFSPFGLKKIFFLKKSFDGFKSTYKTKKKKIFFNVKLLTSKIIVPLHCGVLAKIKLAKTWIGSISPTFCTLF